MSLSAFYWKLKDFEASPKAAAFHYVAGRDGLLYEIRETDYLQVIVPQPEVVELEPVPVGVTLKLPKIPGELLAQAIAFFRYFTELRVEASVNIVWNRETESYSQVCPEQTVSEMEAVVHYPEVTNQLMVVELHSHHVMEAGFSPKDDFHDQFLRVYGVFGRLDQPIPAFEFRAGFNGQHYPVHVADLFELKGVSPEATFPLEWLERVSIV